MAPLSDTVRAQEGDLEVGITLRLSGWGPGHTGVIRELGRSATAQQCGLGKES